MRVYKYSAPFYGKSTLMLMYHQQLSEASHKPKSIVPNMLNYIAKIEIVSTESDTMPIHFYRSNFMAKVIISDKMNIVLNENESVFISIIIQSACFFFNETIFNPYKTT